MVLLGGWPDSWRGGVSAVGSTHVVVWPRERQTGSQQGHEHQTSIALHAEQRQGHNEVIPKLAPQGLRLTGALAVRQVAPARDVLLPHNRAPIHGVGLGKPRAVVRVAGKCPGDKGCLSREVKAGDADACGPHRHACFAERFDCMVLVKSTSVRQSSLSLLCANGRGGAFALLQEAKGKQRLRLCR